MEEFIKILELAELEKIPEEINEESTISVHKIKELIEYNCLTAIDVSDLSGLGFMQPKITIQGREYLKKLKQEIQGMSTKKIRVFISHSSKDIEFVSLLVKLLREALTLSSSQIRCTSLDGYRLPAGAITDDTLKRELQESDSFIGVISSNSNNSMYVTFELGARWGAKLPLIPILAPGVGTEILEGPLTSINALKSDNKHQLEQLLTNIAGELKVEKEQRVIYEDTLEQILKIKSEDLIENNQPSKPKFIDVSEPELKILILISNVKPITSQVIQQHLKIHQTRVEYMMEKLNEKKLIDPILNMNKPTVYLLSSKGRAYLVENNLL